MPFHVIQFFAGVCFCIQRVRPAADPSNFKKCSEKNSESAIGLACFFMLECYRSHFKIFSEGDL